ncbi:MAG: GGDEF domain-containing protein [Planctomycetota bacterium]
MTLTFILPWFPIILGVGVGGRLLSRSHGFALGILCALFWTLLVQTSAGVAIWWDPLAATSLLAGMFSIVAMGGWAGETALTRAAGFSPRGDSINEQAAPSAQEAEHKLRLERVPRIMDRFDDWLETHRNDSNPWPGFDEFVRSALYDCCRATHVRPYRLVGDGEELKPLSEPDPLADAQRFSARKGIVGHVVTTGRSYVAGDLSQGELVSQLANEWEESIGWCFAIREGPRKIGAVVVGQIDVAPEEHMPLLRTVQGLIRQCWCRLLEAARCRAAVLDDPVSGAYTRGAFLHIAEQSLGESYRQGEPVAVAAIALENLRELNDSGQWEVADEVVRDIGAVLRRKIRMDDRLGRFDGSRFIMLLRRVDSELASLIIAQIVSQLTASCRNDERSEAPVVVRCGVVGSGTEDPDLRTLVSGALAQCRRAREEGVQVASDLRGVPLLCQQ